MTSKFNVYHNGYEAFLKGKRSIENAYVYDYDTLLPVYMWPKENQVSQIKSDMDRAIEKGNKTIREHSMLIGTKQKNKMIDDAYMLIGMARFYNRDFFAAIETFNYAARQFPDSENFYYAKLWAGRTQAQMNNFYGAAGTFEEMYKNRNVPKKLRTDIAASMAELYVREGQFQSAISKLDEARKKAPKKEKARWTFLQAQLESALGNGYEASELYGKVIKMGGPYEMKFKAQLNRARNFDIYMDDVSKIYKELNSMLKDEKNTDAKDEIYYVMGEIALREEDFPKAENFLNQSIRTSTVNEQQKGLSYLLLGDINFDFKTYVPAKAYYDSAAQALGPDHKRYEFATKRSKTLERLVLNLNIIELEDSLQRLAALPEAKQRAIFEELIRKIEEEERRQKELEEIAELQAELAAESAALNTGQVAGGSGGWYFYNPQVRNSGLGEFRRIWGRRTLEDDWRRKDKPMNMAGGGDAPSKEGGKEGGDPEGGKEGGDPEGGVTGKEQETAAGRPEPKGDPKDINYYLNQIPKTPEDFDSSNVYIQRAFLEVASAYKEELKDFYESIKALETLDKRFDVFRYEPKMLYLMYLVYGKLEDKPKQDAIKERLLEKYPNHLYTRKMLDPNFGEIDNSEYYQAQLYYKVCFELYNRKQYKECQKCLTEGLEKFNKTELLAKLELLEALNVGKLFKEDKFIAALERVEGSFPNTPESAMARQLLDLLGGNSADAAAQTPEGPYTYDAKAKHNLVIFVPNKGVDMNNIRNSVSDFNTEQFKLEKLSVKTIFLDQRTQMVVVSNLKNASIAKTYLAAVSESQQIASYLPPGKTQTVIFSEANFQTFYSEKNIEAYKTFFEKTYK